ncbi:MAG: LysR family transcriptional regulator [Thermomicrobiales bacterium]
MITFEQLEALRTIVAAGTFSRAAEQLYLTQPALSQRIKHLEQALGTELFDRRRKGRRIDLTPAGEAVLRFADHVSGEFEKIILEIKHIQGEYPSETLNIAVGPNASRYVLPSILARYQCQNPHIRLNLIPAIGLTGFINGLVLDGSAEIGISTETGRDRRLAAAPLIVYHLMAVVSSDHPAARFASLEDHEALNYQFALFPKQGSLLRQALEQQAQQLGKRLDVVVESNDFDVLKNTALRGQSIAILPDLMMQDELHAGRLVPITTLGLPHDLEIDLVYDASRNLSTAARAFLDLAKADWMLSHPEPSVASS